MPVVSVDKNADQFYEVLAYRPEIATAWKRLDTAMHSPSSTLPWRLKENARRVMASHMGCEFCNSFGEPEFEGLTPQEQLAVDFTQQVITDHRAIDEDMIAALRNEYTDEQLVELIAWTCFKLGANVLGSVTGLDPASDAVREFAAKTHQMLLDHDEKRQFSSVSAAVGDGR